MHVLNNVGCKYLRLKIDRVCQLCDTVRGPGEGEGVTRPQGHKAGKSRDSFCLRYGGRSKSESSSQGSRNLDSEQSAIFPYYYSLLNHIAL